MAIQTFQFIFIITCIPKPEISASEFTLRMKNPSILIWQTIDRKAKTLYRI